MNDFEETVKKALAKNGYEVLNKGWPDLLAFKDTPEKGLALFIECKQGSDQLSPEQEKLHRILKRLGIPVYTLRPETLKEFKQKGTALLDERSLCKLREDARVVSCQLDVLKWELESKAAQIKALEGRLDSMLVLLERQKPDDPPSASAQ